MKKLHHLAKELRKNETDTENKLWRYLRGKRFSGLKFRRQEPIGSYIVDFVCFEKRLVVECDGGQHMEQAGKDAIRDRWFQSQGFRVLRFWDNQVLKNTDEVLNQILNACQISPSP